MRNVLMNSIAIYIWNIVVEDLRFCQRHCWNFTFSRMRRWDTYFVASRSLTLGLWYYENNGPTSSSSNTWLFSYVFHSEFQPEYTFWIQKFKFPALSTTIRLTKAGSAALTGTEFNSCNYEKFRALNSGNYLMRWK